MSHFEWSRKIGDFFFYFLENLLSLIKKGESESNLMAEEDSLNRRNVISFQSGAVNSSSEVMMMMMNPCASSAAGMHLNTNMVFPGLKHDAGLAVEWTVQEQYKLEQGLLNYADEPNIMKYIRIASTLQDKTVRDVAMRCRWMTRKRRKAEEHYLGKKVNNRKDKLVELNLKTNIPLVMQQNNTAYPVTMQHMYRNVPISFEVLGISGTTRHLLEQNALAFSQIRANLSTFKLQDNIELFCRTRSNISATLNDMRCTPGIMSQMPPLPESINEDLASSILPNASQSMMLSSPTGIQLKQEPRC